MVDCHKIAREISVSFSFKLYGKKTVMEK